MKSKIKVDGKFYRPVPWVKESNCDGCEFDKNGCLNDADHDNFCDDGKDFAGMIFIPHTKEAMAQYVAMKLVGPDDEDHLA